MIDVDDIRASVSMWDVLNQFNIPYPGPRPGGVKINAIDRPETEPSLHVYDDHWYDYGAGKGGDVIDFVQEWFGCSFMRACQYLGGAADEIGTTPKVEPAKREVLDLTDKFYSDSKPVTSEMAVFLWAQDRWGITLSDLWDAEVRAGRGTLWIPHLAGDGESVIGVKVRSLNGDRWSIVGSTFTERLYQSPSNWSFGARGTAVLCEGEPDTWVMTRELRYEPVDVFGLPSGAGTWNDRFTKQLEGYKSVFIVFDCDDAGTEAAERVDKILRPLVPEVFIKYPGGWEITTRDWDVCDAVKAGWDPKEML